MTDGRRWLAWATLITLTFTGAFNGSALFMGFGRDDGANLFNAVRLPALTYFFDPATLSAVSASALAPWNLLVYQISVALFGLNPAGHHLHLLVIVWATGLATFLFLRLWLSNVAALLGALLFLSGSPVAFISHEEMSGHYLYGLLFTIAAAGLFVRSLRGGGWPLALLSALFYLLAIACKEVFVPLPVALIFLPEGGFPQRLRRSSALGLIVLIYVGWRWLVFGGSLLGPRSVPIHATDALQQLASIPSLLFGSSWVIVTLLVLAGVLRRRLSSAEFLFVLMICGMLLVPLLPVTSGIGIRVPDRLLYLVWWVSACALAWLADRALDLRRGLLLALFASLIVGQLLVSMPWRAQIADLKQRWSQWYGFVQEGQGPRHLVLLNDNEYFWQKYHIDAMRMTAKRLGLGFNRSGQVIADISSLVQSRSAGGNSYVAFDEVGRRLRPPRNMDELDSWQVKLPRGRDGVYVFPAMPKLAFTAAGEVHGAQATGTSVVISGWLPASSLDVTVLVLAPYSCAATAFNKTPGTGSATVAFRLTLACASPQIAQQVAARGCLVSSNGLDYFVPGGQINPDCSRLSQR